MVRLYAYENPFIGFFAVKNVKIKIFVDGFPPPGFFPQKISHFPGRSEICRRYLLARNMSRVVKLFPKEFNFFLGVFLQSKPFLKPDFLVGTIIFWLSDLNSIICMSEGATFQRIRSLS